MIYISVKDTRYLAQCDSYFGIPKAVCELQKGKREALEEFLA